MASTNVIGDQGETIFTTRISKGGLFKVYFLGEKAPIVDFLLEILDPATPYYFLVQVKGTTKGYLEGGELKAPVPEEKMIKLLERCLPTYVAGVDVNYERVFICPAFDPATRYPHIPVTHKIELADPEASTATLQLLKADVIRFWQNSNIDNFKPTYQSLL